MPGSGWRAERWEDECSASSPSSGSSYSRAAVSSAPVRSRISPALASAAARGPTRRQRSVGCELCSAAHGRLWQSSAVAATQQPPPRVRQHSSATADSVAVSARLSQPLPRELLLRPPLLLFAVVGRPWPPLPSSSASLLSGAASRGGGGREGDGASEPVLHTAQLRLRRRTGRARRRRRGGRRGSGDCHAVGGRGCGWRWGGGGGRAAEGGSKAALPGAGRRGCGYSCCRRSQLGWQRRGCGCGCYCLLLLLLLVEQSLPQLCGERLRCGCEEAGELQLQLAGVHLPLGRLRLLQGGRHQPHQHVVLEAQQLRHSQLHPSRHVVQPHTGEVHLLPVMRGEPHPLQQLLLLVAEARVLLHARATEEASAHPPGLQRRHRATHPQHPHTTPMQQPRAGEARDRR